jgi:hypothetical protein
LAAAQREIDRAKKLEPDSFWANLRQAEIYRRNNRLENALASATKAIARIGSISWCSTVGLQADVTCFMASVQRRKAFDAYAVAYADRRMDPAARTRGDEHLAAALELIESAYSLSITRRCTREVQLRATSMLLHLRLWHDRPVDEVEGLFQTVMEMDQKNPGDLGRLALCLILGKTSISDPALAISQASALCLDADELVKSQKKMQLPCDSQGMDRLDTLIRKLKQRQVFATSPFEFQHRLAATGHGSLTRSA